MSECVCGQPAPDATICRHCADRVVDDLKQIPWLVAQLTITLTRQSRMGDRNGPRGRETPLPFDPRASVDLETIQLDLARWALAVAAHRGISVDEPLQPAPLARWLRRWNGAAAQHPQADEYADEVAAMVKAARRTIDRAPDMRCLGPCDVDGCEAWLYVPAQAPIATCPDPECGAQYRVGDRRAWLLEQTVDRLMTAAEIAAQMPWIVGVRIDRKRINRWSSDGRITRYEPHHADTRRSPRFRVGEVVDLAREEAAEKAAREAVGAA